MCVLFVILHLTAFLHIGCKENYFNELEEGELRDPIFVGHNRMKFMQVHALCLFHISRTGGTSTPYLLLYFLLQLVFHFLHSEPGI